MEYNINNWPFKWFGFWKENGEVYQKCPSIVSFIDAKRNAKYDKERLVNYLQNGYIVKATTGKFFSTSTGEKFLGPLFRQTDGEWLWSSDIVDYILQNDLCIPEKMYNWISQHEFIVPDFDRNLIEKNKNDWAFPSV